MKHSSVVVVVAILLMVTMMILPSGAVRYVSEVDSMVAVSASMEEPSSEWNQSAKKAEEMGRIWDIPEEDIHSKPPVELKPAGDKPTHSELSKNIRKITGQIPNGAHSEISSSIEKLMDDDGIPVDEPIHQKPPVTLKPAKPQNDQAAGNFTCQDCNVTINIIIVPCNCTA